MVRAAELMQGQTPREAESLCAGGGSRQAAGKSGIRPDTRPCHGETLLRKAGAKEILGATLLLVSSEKGKNKLKGAGFCLIES